MTRWNLLRPVALACAAAATSPLFAQVTAPGSGSVRSDADDDTIVLSAFTVDASTDRGYYATHAISGSRLNEPIKNVPLSITVITPELMNDLDVDRYDEALRFTAAYNPANGRIRGLTAFGNNRNSAGIDGELETAGIDRIEVVKGPATLMYGVTAAGGQINAISKRALLRRNTYRVDAQVGSESRFRARLDANQVLIQDVFATRVNLKTERYDNRFLDTAKTKSNFLQWATTYKPFRSTTLSLEVEANRPERSNSPTLITENNSVGQPNSSIPIAVLYGAPIDWDLYDGTQRLRNEHTIYRFDWEQEWLPGLVSLASVNVQDRPRDRHSPSTSITNFDVNADGIMDRAIRVNWRRDTYEVDARTYEAMLRYTFDTGNLTHSFLTRYQRRTFDDRSLTFRAPVSQDTYVRLSGVTDWSNNYARPPANVAYTEVFKNSGMWDNTSDLRQYSASYMPRLTTDHGTYRLTAGVIRSKQIKTDGRPFDDATWTRPDPLPVSAIQPWGGARRVLATDLQEGTTTLWGASYAPNDLFTFYGVVTGNFRPTARRTSFGELLPPQRGRTTETGLKFDNVLKGLVSGTITYFNTEELDKDRNDPNIPNSNSIGTDGLPLFTYDAASNVWTRRPGAVFNPNGPRGDWLSVGRYGSQGWDTELIVQVAKQAQAILTYAYIDAETLFDPDVRQIGRIDSQTAKHTVGVFGKYSFDNEALRGLDLTLGFRWSTPKVDLYDYIDGQNVLYELEGDFNFAFGAQYHFRVGQSRPFIQLNVDDIWAQDRVVGNRSNSRDRFKFDRDPTWKLMAGVRF
jgi:outer membrane receptor protein involved in Fe transport